MRLNRERERKKEKSIYCAFDFGRTMFKSCRFYVESGKQTTKKKLKKKSDSYCLVYGSKRLNLIAFIYISLFLLKRLAVIVILFIQSFICCFSHSVSFFCLHKNGFFLQSFEVASSFDCCLSVLDLMCVCFELISIHEPKKRSAQHSLKIILYRSSWWCYCFCYHKPSRLSDPKNAEQWISIFLSFICFVFFFFFVFFNMIFNTFQFQCFFLSCSVAHFNDAMYSTCCRLCSYFLRSFLPIWIYEKCSPKCFATLYNLMQLFSSFFFFASIIFFFFLVRFLYHWFSIHWASTIIQYNFLLLKISTKLSCLQIIFYFNK